MFKKKLSVGLLLLVLLALGGCQVEGTAKNVVYSKAQKSADNIEMPAIMLFLSSRRKPLRRLKLPFNIILTLRILIKV